MALDGQSPFDTITFAGGVLDRHRHVCAFVNGTGSDDSILDPFVKQAVDAGDRVIYITDPAAADAPLSRLRRLGYDATALLETERAVVRTWSDTYLAGGEFQERAMLDLLEGIFDESDSPRVRLVADMGWAADAGVADSLIEFEARANFVDLHDRHVAICWYDASRFDGALLIDILRTHPVVLLGGMLQENPFFVPPAEFLRDRGARADS